MMILEYKLDNEKYQNRYYLHWCKNMLQNHSKDLFIVFSLHEKHKKSIMIWYAICYDRQSWNIFTPNKHKMIWPV